MTKTTSDCAITIDVNGVGFGSVSVDGTEIKSVQAVSVGIAANEAPAVNLRLAVRERAQLRCEGAVLVVDDVVMPASVELALWRHLCGKYGREADATTIQSTAREWALKDA